MEIKQLELKDLIPYANNPRKKQAIDKVASSIKEFGWQQPIVVDEEMVIVVGHTRYQAAQKLGLDKVPVRIATGLTDAQIKAYRLLDNRANQDALWDDDMLKIEVQDIDKMDIDLALTGFDEKELDKLLFVEQDGLTDEDAVPEDVEPRVKLGELWQLGNHRLLCGDATNNNDIEILFEDKKADLYLTDPPYNVDYVGKTKDALKIQNDKFSDDKFNNFLTDAFISSATKIKAGGSFYIFHADSEGYNFRSACKKANFNTRKCLIWSKNSMVMGRQDYHWQHEPILYGWMEGGSHSWYSDRKQTTILNFARPTKSKEHPTMKPVDIIEYLIKNSSKQEDIILDTFLGSGSTLIACEKTNRSCYGLELDPKYCDVIIKRWEDFTGQTAKLLERGTDTNSFKEEEKWQEPKNTILTQTKSLN
jgi:DNA modification methylase